MTQQPLPPAARRPVPPTASEESLTKVQRWVASSLAVITILHLSAGMIAATYAIDDARPDAHTARVGLCIVAGGFGIVAIAAGRAIHGKSLVSPWLLLGIVPTLIGLYLVA
jgi:hypothetical protein